MILKLWLVKNRIKLKDFSKEIGITRTHLGEITLGRRKPGLPLAMLIEMKTNGEVKAEELLKGGE